ncbi:histidine kinase dimerization/phospho-acceptor domain-containing protein [Clostridium beijerinckii]|uniref:histidine kinase dimerization/phospho-acceptor domain-containing protein n=1 Tax=Clostridium beijerinckii TaxID=1520 RepID=UPI001F4C007C|nr:histidine kinase dimerization/phospho-acceptor domain-containing protein [Clostridium beijerinckii]
MKDEFITLITHEFKTPINVIYSAIQLIEQVYINQIPQSVKNLIGSIKRNAFRQLRLVKQFIGYY